VAEHNGWGEKPKQDARWKSKGRHLSCASGYQGIWCATVVWANRGALTHQAMAISYGKLRLRRTTVSIRIHRKT
jgi:hypothetical protein